MDDLFDPSSRSDRAQTWPPVMNIILAAAGVVAIAALVLVYGFGKNPPIPEFWLHIIQSTVVVVFIADRVGRVLL
ncbi:MAG: hypothetical protein QGG25_05955, partial [Phycisphaerae bacterium]|nr:hypothetical protein [Phycisphaerae bacterium]